MYISVYNLFYTSLPVLAVGVFDQDVSDKNSILYPQLYRPGHYNLFFNKKEFLLSALQGCYVSLVLFFIPFGSLYDFYVRMEYLKLFFGSQVLTSMLWAQMAWVFRTICCCAVLWPQFSLLLIQHRWVTRDFLS